VDVIGRGGMGARARVCGLYIRLANFLKKFKLRLLTSPRLKRMIRNMEHVKTLKLRIKDKHAKVLRAMARDVNTVWNY